MTTSLERERNGREYVWRNDSRSPNDFAASHFTRMRRDRRPSRIERIPLANHKGEVIYANVGDTFGVGPGVYRITNYSPNRKWGHPHGTEPTVTCALIQGQIIGDFEHAAKRDVNGGVIIELCTKTLSQFYMTQHEKAHSRTTGGRRSRR